MKLVKLTEITDIGGKSTKTIYVNPCTIMCVRPNSSYSEVEVLFPYCSRRFKVKETIEDIQSQLEEHVK